LLLSKIPKVEREASDDEHAIVDPDVVSNDMRQAVDYIIGVFRVPLKAKAFSVEAIQDELEEAVAYARRYLPICTESYKKIWYKLHTCPDAVKWPHILTLYQLIFSLPFSTSRVEQIFSQLRRNAEPTSTMTLCMLCLRFVRKVLPCQISMEILL